MSKDKLSKVYVIDNQGNLLEGRMDRGPGDVIREVLLDNDSRVDYVNVFNVFRTKKEARLELLKRIEKAKQHIQQEMERLDWLLQKEKEIKRALR